MGGFRTPGPQRNTDPSIEDGTMACVKSPKPGVTDQDSPAKNADRPDTEQTNLKIAVFLFGGFRASDNDMSAWLKSARDQRKDVMFHAFPYPEGMSSMPPDNVLDKFGPAIKSIRGTEASKIFVVGHSSGCAIANAVARRLKENEKINLVALDGFLPDSKQLQRDTTQVWGAINGKFKSLHFDGMKKGGKDKFHPFPVDNPNCTNKVALHFSLVNTAANDVDIKDFNDIKNGYKACVANLCWLN